LIALQETARVAVHLNDALTACGYRTVLVPVHNSLGELKKALQPFSPETAFIFNNCDGFNGVNSAATKVTRLIETLGFRHTGSTASIGMACIDKGRTKRRLEAAGVPTPRYQVFYKAEGSFRHTFPAIVKPLTDDASLGIDLQSVVRTQAEMLERITYVIEQYGQAALVEEFIPGRELAVSMWGNKTVEALPISEQDYSLIENPLQHLLTYESKWMPDSYYYNNILTCCPARLDPEDVKRVSDTALRAYRAIGMRDFGRADIRYKDGIPYVIDMNEVPDFSPGAGFSNSATAAGYSYIEMVRHLLEVALEREGWQCRKRILKSLSPRLQTASASSD
jgi:D-alanine-D-alanine ligase